MPDENERFQRWQRITIEQLGYAVNLFLTFAVAALGFCFSLLKDKDFILAPLAAKWTMIACMVAFPLSAACGIFCTLNRLRDFRATTMRARIGPEAPSQEEVRGYGKITWRSFYVQVISFGLGALFLTFTLLIAYGSTLI
jgi:hypothetical protein